MKLFLLLLFVVLIQTHDCTRVGYGGGKNSRWRKHGLREKNRAKTEILKIIEENEARLGTGTSVAVYYEGSPLVTRGYGYYDYPNQKKTNRRTGFRIGSISKLFTAISMMQLVEQGRVCLNDSIYKYLPDYTPTLAPGVVNDTRVKDLLSHVNGLPSLWTASFFSTNKTSEDPTEALRRLPLDMSEDYVISNRREIAAYSNAAVSLAGLIVERVSGVEYATYIRRNIMRPLRMLNSYSVLPSYRVNIALPHDETNQSWVSKEIGSLYPAGAVISCAADMQKFMHGIIETWNGDHVGLLKPETLHKMLVDQTSDVKYYPGNFFRFGLGFMLKEVGDYSLIGHDGSIETFSSSCHMIPELELGVFMSTIGNGDKELFSKILLRLYELETEEPAPTPPPRPPAPTEAVPPYVGEFVVPLGFPTMFRLNHVNGTTQISVLGGTFDLVPVNNNTWTLPSIQEITFTAHPSEERYTFPLLGAVAVRLVQEPVDVPEWDARLGIPYTAMVYYIQRTTAAEASGVMLVQFSRQRNPDLYVCTIVVGSNVYARAAPMRIISDNLAQLQGVGRNAGLFIRINDDGSVYFSGRTAYPPQMGNATAATRGRARVLEGGPVLEEVLELFSSKSTIDFN